jgi:hypothetical protein
MLRALADKLKTAGIDIHHLYATALSNQDKCLIVFSTSYNDHALLALKGLDRGPGEVERQGP